MTLITRITRLFKADIHGILDCLEEPEAVVKQAVRDMEEEIAKNVSRQKDLESKRARARNLASATENQLRDIERQVAVAFDAKDDALAKSFVRRRLQAERTLKNVRVELDRSAHEFSELEGIISSQKSQLQGVVEKLNLFAEAKGRETKSCGYAEHADVVTDADVEIAFIEEKRQRSGEVQVTANS